MYSPGSGGWPVVGNGASLGRSSSTRFAPHDFRYNGRVAMALLPSLVVLAAYGGNAVSAALAVSLELGPAASCGAGSANSTCTMTAPLLSHRFIPVERAPKSDSGLAAAVLHSRAGWPDEHVHP